MTLSNVLAKSVLGLTLVATGASAHALSLNALLHLHPHLASTSTQVARLELKNPNPQFREVRIGNTVYTVLPHQGLKIKAPVGTPVYAANSLFRTHRKGSVLAEVAPGEQTLSID